MLSRSRNPGQLDRFALGYGVAATSWLSLLALGPAWLGAGPVSATLLQLLGGGLLVGVTVVLLHTRRAPSAVSAGAATAASPEPRTEPSGGIVTNDGSAGNDGKRYTEGIEALRTDWDRVRPILDRVVDEIYVIDAAGMRVVEASRGASLRSGFAARTLLGQVITDIFDVADRKRVAEHVEIVRSGQVDGATIDANRRGSAGDAWVRVRFAPVNTEDPPIILVLVMDRSDIASLEQRVARAEGRIAADETRRLHLEAGVDQARDTVVRLTMARDEAILATKSAIAERNHAQLRLEEIQEDRDCLVAAIEQVDDIVSILDGDGRLALANRAWQRATGYDRAAAIGTGSDLRRSGLISEGAGHALWRALARGENWGGPLVSLRADGTFLQSRAVLTKVAASHGVATRFVVTEQVVDIQGNARLETVRRDRLAVASSLARLRAGLTVSETAHAICREIVSLEDISIAAFLELGEASGGGMLGLEPSEVFGLAAGYHVDAAFLATLRKTAEKGPFSMDISTGPQDNVLAWALRAGGIRTFSAAPIVQDGITVAILGIGMTDVDEHEAMIEHVPTLLGYGAMATALVGPELIRRSRDAAASVELRALIEQGLFSVVFQPVVDLATDAVRGFEALTRFNDSSSPRDRFEAAHRLDLGTALELATFEKASAVGRELPRAAWLSINISPIVLVENVDRIRAMIRLLRHKCVLELSGRPSGDAGDVVSAVASLGPTVVLAVDDAGEGGIGYGELAALAPRIIKLGMATTRGVERDEKKRALVAGMVQLAASTGSELIAKGIERETERSALLELGVRSGQGMLFGAPAPIEAWADDPTRARPATVRTSDPPTAADRAAASAAPLR